LLSLMKKVNVVFNEVQKEGRKYLLEPEAKTVCMEYGIPVTNFKVAKNETEAVQFAEEIGFPFLINGHV